ncbi:MAG: hypothetical protein JNK90_04845 [Planctomycetaceae bacterium]|nr:hypothetical protein [Planctomycetaceae bacterium]
MAKLELRFCSDREEAMRELKTNDCRVVLELTPRVLVVEIPDDRELGLLSSSSSSPVPDLDDLDRLVAMSWGNVSLDSAPRETQMIKWDDSRFLPPAPYVPKDLDSIAPPFPLLSTGTPTSRYLIGSIAVGIILVSRNQPPEVLTSADQQTILTQVQQGLTWLATQEPRANVSFVLDIRRITIATPPGPYGGTGDLYEQRESGWRDAALAQMGYPAGRTGYRRYVNELRQQRGTDWSYVAFFCRYPLHHFAYAVVEKIVMDFANGGWGPNQIDRVFAHESCHIFGAADEYGACTCGGNGHLDVLNGNCVNCVPAGTQANCLMNANTFQFCNFTRGQIGWDNRLLNSDLRAVTIRSASESNMFLRMFAGNLEQPQSQGGGIVNCQYGVGGGAGNPSLEHFRIEPQIDGSVAIRSNANPAIYLRMDPQGIAAALPNGGGRVNCQFGIGGGPGIPSLEKFVIVPIGGGISAIRSASYPNIYLRMYSEGMGSPSPNGGGIVNCQFGIGGGPGIPSLEHFIIAPA